MNNHIVEIMAGMTSSLIFVSGNLPMLVKAFRTKDLHSYSLLQLILGNVGNTVYWLYVRSLPVGPIWYLQGFFSISSGLMLLFYLRYELKWFPLNQKSLPAFSLTYYSVPSLVPVQASLSSSSPAVVLACSGSSQCQLLPECYQRLQLLNSIKGLPAMQENRFHRPDRFSSGSTHLAYFDHTKPVGFDPGYFQIPSGYLAPDGPASSRYPLKIGDICGSPAYQCLARHSGNKAGLSTAAPR